MINHTWVTVIDTDKFGMFSVMASKPQIFIDCGCLGMRCNYLRELSTCQDGAQTGHLLGDNLSVDWTKTSWISSLYKRKSGNTQSGFFCLLGQRSPVSALTSTSAAESSPHTPAAATSSASLPPMPPSRLSRDARGHTRTTFLFVKRLNYFE